jgi:hypothetical protein
VSTWEERAEAAYQESLIAIERAKEVRDWADLIHVIRKWITRNWKLLLGILIGYVLAGAAFYLDAWFQAMGITR